MALNSLKELIATTAYSLQYDRYLQLDAIIRDDPSFHLQANRYSLTEALRVEKAFDNFRAVELLSNRLGGLSRDEKIFLYSRINQFTFAAGALGVIINALEVLSSPAQAELWVPQAEQFQAIISIGITELGHGTEMQKLETIAHYDLISHEFTINSPNLQSTKWYIAACEHTTHMIIFARTIIQRKDEGILPLYVQIRSLSTLELLPGVMTGDIGPRAGLELQQYSFFIFTNFKAPASALMQRFVSIERGQLRMAHPQAKSMIMSSLVQMRAILVATTWRTAANGLTIALRFLDIRAKLSNLQGPSQEINIIGYNQLNLVSALAVTFAQLFGGKAVLQLAISFVEDLKQGRYEDFSELNAVSAACKAFYTWSTLSCLETCKQACGALGYSIHSGIQQLFLNYMPAVTYEGDNTVMAQLSAKILIGAQQKLVKGKAVPGNFSFLIENTSLSVDLEDEDFGTALFGRVTSILTKNLIVKTAQLTKAGVKPIRIEQSYIQQDLKLIGKAYCYFFTHRTFAATVKSVADTETARLLGLLRQMYLATKVIELGSVIFREGILGVDDFKAIKASLDGLFKSLRPYLHMIVDSFDFSDAFLCSALGRKDGLVYATLLNLVKTYQENPDEILSKTSNMLAKPFAKL